MATFRVHERTTPRYTATLKDETGAVVPGSALSALRLTLYNLGSGAIINTRDDQNVLGTSTAVNGVTVSEAGLLTWDLDEADLAIQSARVPVGGVERHVALFTWVYDGTRRGRAEEYFDVVNLGKVS